MAKTYRKEHWRAYYPDDSGLAYGAVYLPEGASQTFVTGAPLIFASGYAVIAANTNPISDAIIGFAMDAGSNTTAGAVEIKVMPALPGVHIQANFLGAAAADNVLAATDLGLSRDVDVSATLINSAPGYYIEDGAGSAAVRIVSFRSNSLVENHEEVIAKAGDTNARVTAAWLSSKTAWV